jgi:hypothetical protein
MTIIVGIHTNTQATVDKLMFCRPPLSRPLPLSNFVLQPFNKNEFSLSFSKDNSLFNDGSEHALRATTPLALVLLLLPQGLHPLYYLHLQGLDATILNGTAVMSLDSLCPLFDGSSTTNLFKCHFGIEFHDNNHTYVWPFLPFEFTSCFGFINQLQYCLSQHGNWFALDAGIPSLMSVWVFDHMLECLLSIRNSTLEIFEPNQFAAPAATIQAFLGSAVSTTLPSCARWIQAYDSDKDLCLIRSIVTNSSLLSNKTLRDMNYNYHSALRKLLIVLEDGVLIYRELIVGEGSYTRLQLVPRVFYNILFVPLHLNPVGGHLNAYCTLHRLRLHFYWPGMYSYIKRMCSACPGCTLANPTKGHSCKLVYNFPIEVPFLVPHVNAYSAGAHPGFEGSNVYLIACCGMCTFGALEPIASPNATTFASAIMKIQLHYELCHTIVLDKDSKFFGVFHESLDLLQINCHVLSGDNHNLMLMERLCRYFNKGLRIMTNKWDTMRVALEALLLLLYAWNSCPVPGTDISRSLVAVGREFAFPIDYLQSKHWELTSSPATVDMMYSKQLAERLSTCRDIAMLLVREQGEWHRALINSCRRDPCVYLPGDIVFARRATRSDAARGCVGKLEYAFTGPWRITALLHGGSYSLKHCHNVAWKEKKHAANLVPYPSELIPFEPVNGADTRYSQLYKPISTNPFKEAGIKGFTPPSPFRVPANFIDVGNNAEFCWPTLAESIDDIKPFPWRDNDEHCLVLSDDIPFSPAVMYNCLPPLLPLAATPANPSPPSITMLAPLIISSADKLFFIAHTIGTAGCYEWRLVCIAFQDSVSLYPPCLQDGRFLVEFYMAHPADARYNAINQRYWLQYCDHNSPTFGTMDAHLITPSDTSAEHASHHHLVTVRSWVNLTHCDTYIHGPFDFAILRGRKTCDRIGQDS